MSDVRYRLRQCDALAVAKRGVPLQTLDLAFVDRCWHISSVSKRKLSTRCIGADYLESTACIMRFRSPVAQQNRGHVCHCDTTSALGTSPTQLTVLTVDFQPKAQFVCEWQT
jgi:hypothetical protein